MTPLPRESVKRTPQYAHLLPFIDLSGWRLACPLRNTSMKSNTKSKMIHTGEHVRVVPLHCPKPSVSIDDLARGRRAGKDQDLFDGKPHALAAPAHLTYMGGPLITNVQIFTVFWGKLWGANASSQQM